MLNKKQIAEIIAFDRAARLRGEYDPRRYGTLSDRATAYQSAHVRAADSYGGIPVADAWTPYYCGKGEKPTRKTLRYNYIVPAKPFTGSDAERRNRREREVTIYHVAVRLNKVFVPVVKDVAHYSPKTNVTEFRDMGYHMLGGWIVYWDRKDYENRAVRAWICPSGVGEWVRHPCKWSDGLKFPWHETVNPSALKGTRYEWSQYTDGRHVGLCDWLSLYRAEPHVETLAKLGLDVLITPYAIKSLKDAKVREWVLAHAAEIKRCGSVKEILWAAKHNSTLKAAHNRFRFVDEMKRRWSGDYYGHYYGMDPDVKIQKVRFDYDRLMKLVAKWHVGVDEYVRYLQEATRAHRDLTNEGTLYPPTAGGRDAFVARTEELEREGDRYETAARRRELRAERAERKREEERMAELLAKRGPEIERFQKSLDRSKVLHGCGYKLVLAKSQKELVAEGKRMHNCVGCGTYGEGIVVGRCLILTIAAGKDRYCVEIDRKSWTVRQCYARHNEAAPEEIRDLAKSVAGIIKAEFKKIKAKKAA